MFLLLCLTIWIAWKQNIFLFMEKLIGNTPHYSSPISKNYCKVFLRDHIWVCTFLIPSLMIYQMFTNDVKIFSPIRNVLDASVTKRALMLFMNGIIKRIWNWASRSAFHDFSPLPLRTITVYLMKSWVMFIQFIYSEAQIR